jgi:hypothetical protein
VSVTYTKLERSLDSAPSSPDEPHIILFLDDSNDSAGIAYRAETFEHPFEVRYAVGEVDSRPRAVRQIPGAVINYHGRSAVAAMFAELTPHDANVEAS